MVAFGAILGLFCYPPVKTGPCHSDEPYEPYEPYEPCFLGWWLPQAE